MEPNLRFGNLADDLTVKKVVAALEKNNITAFVASTGAEAKKKVLELVPKGAQVMTMTSMTLDALGLPEVLNSKDYDSVRDKFGKADARTQRQLGTAPDWVVGSCHAITEDGQIVFASNSGSQLPAHAYGAAKVVLVAGTQKIVKNLQTKLQRFHKYKLPP